MGGGKRGPPGGGITALGSSASLLVLGSAFLFQVPQQPAALESQGLRVMVLERDDQDAAAWRAIRNLGANVVATLRPPSDQTDEIARGAGLTYLAFLTTDDIQTLARDPFRIAEAMAERGLAGFYYWDANVLEGFTTPETQQKAYSTLKGLFPEKLVLYPTRLDPIVWSPDFLDGYFRPEYTDLVTPYFYPVGTTTLGPAQEGDAWPVTLGGLLSELAPRLPPGKGLLPVLQGFEQTGYPVGSGFLAEQLAVYRRSWPTLSNVAIFSWKIAEGETAPLVELADLPTLQRGVCTFFASLSPGPARCRWSNVIPFR